MSYAPTTWVEKVSRVGPTLLNKLEQGLQAAAALVDTLFDLTSGNRVRDELLITETHDRRYSASTAGTSSRVFGMAVYLRAGQVITSGVVYPTLTTGTVTLLKLGIYDSNFNLVASSANAGTFTAATPKTITLSSPYTVPSTGWYYVAFFNVNSVNPSMCAFVATPSASAPMTAGSVRTAWQQTGQADLPATATPSNAAENIWVGLK